MATKKQLDPRVLFDQKEADKAQPPGGPTGQPMRRVFVGWTERPSGLDVDALPQVWRRPVTGVEQMDDWQKHCLKKAAELAAVSDAPVLYYHTRAWRANLMK